MIRPATPSDIPAIKQCAKLAYQQYVVRMGKKPAPMVADFSSQLASHRIDVYANEDSIDGYIVLQDQGAALMLENVAVFPSKTGNGIGRALINHAMTIAKLENFSRVILYTNEKMHENLTLYPKLGFIETHRITEDGFNRVYFEYSL